MSSSHKTFERFLASAGMCKGNAKLCQKFSLQIFSAMTITPINVRNYFKLDLLIVRACIRLRQLFKDRYSLFNNGLLWNDTPQCSATYFANTVKNNKKINLTPVQKNLVLQGNSNEWDLTTVTALLLYTDRPRTLQAPQIQQLDIDDKLLVQLRDVRNTLAHHASKNIPDQEYHQLWSTLVSILVALGDDETELEKCKDDSVFEISDQTINEMNMKELQRLNLLGNQAHRDERFSEAIAFFTEATVLAGVRDRDRALVFSNMSASRLALYEQEEYSPQRLNISDATDQRYRALHDAKQARLLWPTSWQGHFRVGKVYAALNEHEKAIRSLEKAMALDPTSKKIQDALYDSRQIDGRQSRQEHLDPRTKPTTMDELFQDMHQSWGFDPAKIRDAHRRLERIDPVGADVVRGHKYFHGDVGIKQDYEQAAKYFAKAASKGNAEGMYNLALLTDRGWGVKKDHRLAFKLLEQAAAQPAEHPFMKGLPNIGVAQSEHALGLRYCEGVVVQRNPSVAAGWYQRASDHGSAEAANNLGLMYQSGIGVERDLDRAQQLLELSSRRGDPNAMLTLAEHLLESGDFDMAQMWHDRACEAGNVLAQTNRHDFGIQVHRCRLARPQFSPKDEQFFEKAKNLFKSFKNPSSVSRSTTGARVYDMESLEEHAQRGSLTAKTMCQALEHFYEAFYILTQSNSLTSEEENHFIHELSQCYRLEHIVAQIPTMELHRKVEETIKRVLERCGTESSSVDEDVRVCYAVFHMDSHRSTLEFVNACKKKYPKVIYFFELSASLNGWLKHYEAALFEANSGLEIDRCHIELLYYKAVALRLIENSNHQAIIDAYQAFLFRAPRDHRKVPESLYSVASCCLMDHDSEESVNMAKAMYEEGLAAEKVQLPCFLPYKSNPKILLQLKFDETFLAETPATAVPDHRSRLKDPTRIDIITRHRRWIRQLSKIAATDPNRGRFFRTESPRVKQPVAKSLIGLKSISLREMDPNKDYVCTGYVLAVTIVEEARFWQPSIHLVVEDENLDCECMVIYGFPEAHGSHLTKDVFTAGTRMNIVNPYHRIGANDRKPMIRIDDFASIIMQNESERRVNMCQCCYRSNAAHVCNRCKRARYCSKECQTLDWKQYEHKLVCQK